MYPKDYDNGECQTDVGVMGYMGYNCSSCQAQKQSIKSCKKPIQLCPYCGGTGCDCGSE